MNEEKIIKELISQHGLNLKEKDPIFATLFLNSIALREYLAEFESHLAESITNVAIKEDVTIRKLQKLINEAQLKDRQETARALNQFADNFQGRLHALLNQQDTTYYPKSWLWFIVCLLVGLITGLILGKYLF